jgi:hypothetical protein
MRFRPRHVHKTIADHLEAELDTLGWVTAPINFGTTAVTFSEFEPDEPNPVEIEPNTVSIVLGDELPDQELELGGRLLSTKFVLFVDVYGANSSIARSICSDVKDVLADLYLTVLDYTSNANGVATAERIYIERDSIVVERPDGAADAKDIRKNWRVVKATVEVTFQD